jgi:ABC-type iron transport system FetAB permease component
MLALGIIPSGARHVIPIAGMILAGADPLQAVRLQVVVVFMLLAAVSLTATLVSLHSTPGACSRRRCSCDGWGRHP